MRILETALYAEDLDVAREFYCEKLGLEMVSFDPDRDLFLRLEGSMLILFKASRTRIADSGVPPHGADGPGHLAFAAPDGTLETWRRKLVATGIPIIQEIDWKNGAKSICFKDPAGNILEFAEPALWGF